MIRGTKEFLKSTNTFWFLKVDKGNATVLMEEKDDK